jgi:hypothetical protein
MKRGLPVSDDVEELFEHYMMGIKRLRRDEPDILVEVLRMGEDLLRERGDLFTEETLLELGQVYNTEKDEGVAYGLNVLWLALADRTYRSPLTGERYLVLSNLLALWREVTHRADYGKRVYQFCGLALRLFLTCAEFALSIALNPLLNDPTFLNSWNQAFVKAVDQPFPSELARDLRPSAQALAEMPFQIGLSPSFAYGHGEKVVGNYLALPFGSRVQSRRPSAVTHYFWVFRELVDRDQEANTSLSLLTKYDIGFLRNIELQLSPFVGVALPGHFEFGKDRNVRERIDRKRIEAGTVNRSIGEAAASFNAIGSLVFTHPITFQAVLEMYVMHSLMSAPRSLHVQERFSFYTLAIDPFGILEVYNLRDQGLYASPMEKTIQELIGEAYDTEQSKGRHLIAFIREINGFTAPESNDVYGPPDRASLDEIVAFSVLPYNEIATIHKERMTEAFYDAVNHPWFVTRPSEAEGGSGPSQHIYRTDYAASQ